METSGETVAFDRRQCAMNGLRLFRLFATTAVLVLFAICSEALAVSVVKCDLFEDYNIDFKDLEVIAENWLVDCTTEDCNGADLDDSGSVDFIDYSLYAEHFGTDPNFVRVWGTIQERLAGTMDALKTNPIYIDANYPRSTDSAGEWRPRSEGHWASGFLPGALWYVYKESSEPNWLQLATDWTEPLERHKDRTKDHESGFIVYRSFGFGHHITGNAAYKQVVLGACESLVTRYDANVGCIKSWYRMDDPPDPNFRVITDGMMMLEMLFWGVNNGGDPNWYDIAVSHSNKTMENNVRANGSSWQIVDYNQATGVIVDKWNKQGYDENSTWSRGQAWGICGFTIAYRETGDANYLQTAKKMGDYFIDNLPVDYVPYWDFNAPGIPNELKDSSAASIAASGLLELSSLVAGPVEQARYYDAACNILESLCSPAYLAEDPNRGILLHGTANGNSVTAENDCSLIYGDHFFIEALLRKEGMTIP